MAIVNRKNISTSGFDQDVLTTSASGEQVINFGAFQYPCLSRYDTVS